MAGQNPTTPNAKKKSFKSSRLKVVLNTHLMNAQGLNILLITAIKEKNYESIFARRLQ